MQQLSLFLRYNKELHIITYSAIYIYQSGTALDYMTKEKVFPEPRLLLLLDSNKKISQGFITAEKSIIFEVDNFCMADGLASLMATYYVFHVSYPRSTAAVSTLMFCQEILLGKPEAGAKKTAKYHALVNSLTEVG